jgi:hypothetical protein
VRALPSALGIAIGSGTSDESDYDGITSTVDALT